MKRLFTCSVKWLIAKSKLNQNHFLKGSYECFLSKNSKYIRVVNYKGKAATFTKTSLFISRIFL